MIPFLRSIYSPILSLFIIILGNGYLLTLVPVRAKLEGFSQEMIGYIAAAYFTGILIGALKINKIIEGVGHIRAFAFFASAISCITLFQGIFVDPYIWIVFRFLFGLCIGGIFITIESWLLVKSSHEMRGVALSLYMTVFYASQSLSQLFLGLADPKTILPFVIVVVLTSLSVLPLALTKTQAPIIEEHGVSSPWKLLKLTPVAVVSAMFSGFILGPIYGILPIYAQDINYSVEQISWIMGIVIFGGLLFQWPIGTASDRIDRRKVLLFSSILCAALSFTICLYPQMSLYYFLAFIFVYGGFSFVIYPLSISHACDVVDAKDIVSATGAILLSYGVGSIIGPVVSAYSMRHFGPIGLFYFLFVVCVVLSLFILSRIIVKSPVPKEEKLHYSNMPRTTPLASELDPRTEEGKEKQESKE